MRNHESVFSSLGVGCVSLCLKSEVVGLKDVVGAAILALGSDPRAGRATLESVEMEAILLGSDGPEPAVKNSKLR